MPYHHYITTSRLLKLFAAAGRGKGHTIGPLQMSVDNNFQFFEIKIALAY